MEYAEIVAAHQTDECCRVCAGSLVMKFRLPVLHDRFEAYFYECQTCGTLQVVNPTWLGQAYADEALPQPNSPDAGRFVRSFSAYAYICSLLYADVITRNTRTLDFGGGYGLLTQMLLDGGFDAWQFDEYVKAPMMAPNRCVASLADATRQPFDLITSFEVLEHLLQFEDLFANFARVLKPEGTLVFSTGVYQPTKHDSTWYYLSRMPGQHITFLSHRGIQHLAALANMKSVAYWPSDDGFMIILSRKSCPELAVGVQRALAVLREPGFEGTICRHWDFIHRSEIKISSQVVVQPALLIPRMRSASASTPSLKQAA
jgi:2-polyprenyl-3-methyl-5-hydroxy-6-metoxy-1,4-benzoquinol methylase